MAVAYAYLYLFDERFVALRNPYDPNFAGRAICTTPRWKPTCEFCKCAAEARADSLDRNGHQNVRRDRRDSRHRLAR